MPVFDIDAFLPENAMYIRPISQENVPDHDIQNCAFGVFDRDGDLYCACEFFADALEVAIEEGGFPYTVH